MKVEIEAKPVQDPMEEKEKKAFGPYEEWEIKCAVNTLLEAEEIKADAEKMKYVAPFLKKKIANMKKAVTSIQDLKDIRSAKMSEVSLEEGEENYESED